MKYRIFSILVLAILLVSIAPINAQDNITCEEGFRIVEHDLLAEAICVPENPERIIAQHLTALELMLMLDMQPVAQPDQVYLETIYGGAPATLSRVNELIGETPVFGALEINVEAILSADPDLVLVYQGQAGIEQLREFTTVIEAPVAAFQPVNWSDLTDFFAEVIGVSEEYDALYADYEARIETLHELKLPEFDGASMVYVQNSGDVNYVGLPGMPLRETMADAGFVPVETLPVTPQASLEEYGRLIFQLSDEQISLVDADVIIIVNGNVNQDDRDSAAAVIEGYRSDPLWSTLDAVENDRMFAKAVYWQSNGFVSVHAVVDDMFVDFAGVDPADVSPNPFLTNDEPEMEATEEADD
mgnify:CR=1 FL=1